MLGSGCCFKGKYAFIPKVKCKSKLDGNGKVSLDRNGEALLLCIGTFSSL